MYTYVYGLVGVLANQIETTACLRNLQRLPDECLKLPRRSGKK
jgi:hypothetical protein